MSKFNELINGPTPVLVDFYATWCGPCKELSPVLEEVAVDLKGKVKVIKIDVDKNPAAAQIYQVRGVPTMILFKNGKQLWKQSGVMHKEMLIGLIHQNLL
jgi:thioredoxin 1